MLVIETNKLEWTAEGGKAIPLSEMHDDHLLRAAAWCQNRLAMAKGIIDKLHPSLHEQAVTHNGRRLEEWVNLLVAVINERAKQRTAVAAATRRAELEAALAELESPQEKIKRLRAELESLNEIV